jgi:hypothetical protein
MIILIMDQVVDVICGLHISLGNNISMVPMQILIVDISKRCFLPWESSCDSDSLDGKTLLMHFTYEVISYG